MPSASLLDTVGGLLERTYLIRSGIECLEPFVIGDSGFREFYAKRAIECSVDTADGVGAKTLVRQTESGLAACIYFPDAMIRRLEDHPPQYGLNALNFAAFATFVEEIDHLLLLAGRARARRPVTLLELELHANVSKYLVLSRFLAEAGRPLVLGQRLWLRRRLFDEAEFDGADPVLAERYRRAASWAARFLADLAELPPQARLTWLRRFHAAGAHDKVRMIESGIEA